MIVLRETTYYSENREAVLRKARTKVTCECGAVVSYSSMGWHRHSQRHAIWEQSIKSESALKSNKAQYAKLPERKDLSGH
jgi:hypothetical protein